MIYAIIGSGPSGVHAALTLLEKGKQVVMFDVGLTENKFPLPLSNFNQLKSLLDDPINYFLGEDLQGLIIPTFKKIFDYPPSRNFKIKTDDIFSPYETNEFNPVLSHSKGGLGIAWGANCVEFDSNDLKNFPISYSELKEPYKIAESRIPLTGPEEDELSPYLSFQIKTGPPLKGNHHDIKLLNLFKRKAAQKNHQFLMGQSRMAVKNTNDDPSHCIYCQRCLWGCPQDSIYNPLQTLEECKKNPNFTYIQGYVSHLLTSENKITDLIFIDNLSKETKKIKVDLVLLSAGAIGSGSIFLRTLKNDIKLSADLRTKPRTKGLMDTSVLKIPYVFLPCLGLEENTYGFQFNRLILAYLNKNQDDFPHYIHGEILSLSSFIFHPLIETLPFGSRLSSQIFFLIKASLGVLSFFLPDKLHDSNFMYLEEAPDFITGDKIKFKYQEKNKQELLSFELIKNTNKLFKSLWCLMSKKNIMRGEAGSGIHYAGTIPMSNKPDYLCVNSSGQSYLYNNLYVTDGASFPALPSKSLTLTLMANAIRVAQKL